MLKPRGGELKNQQVVVCETEDVLRRGRFVYRSGYRRLMREAGVV